MNIINCFSKMKHTNINKTKAKFTRCMVASAFLLLCFVGSIMAQAPYVIYSGAYYMAHVKVNDAWTLQGTTTFGPECIWYSTNTNNYYFVDGTTKYYLTAARSASSSVTLTQESSLSAALDKTDGGYYFYNWDWGLARGYKYTDPDHTCDASDLSDDGTECWNVYWVVYDGAWKMSSTHSYNPVANSAEFRRVRINEHAQTITSETGGLSTISPSESFSMYLSDTKNLTATVTDYSYIYTPAYTTYSISEISCNDASWTSRICDTNWSVHNYYDNKDNFSSIPRADTGSNLASSATYNWVLSGDGAEYLSLSATNVSNPTLSYDTANTSGDKTATLTLTVTYGDASTQVRTVAITVETECGNPSQASSPVITYENVTVSWVNTEADGYIVYWSTDRSNWESANVSGTTSYTISGLDYGTTYYYKVAAICSSVEKSNPQEYSFTTNETPGLLVYGSVFGGGRMADVTGKTEVVIINCDSISAVYGGNDIAGQVNGQDGSKITLGVNSGDSYDSYGTTSETIKVKVGSVYGGGNGYYAYDGLSFNAASDSYSSHSVANNSSVNFMTKNHQVGEVAWTNKTGASATLTFPTIVKTKIVVANNYVTIDSLFGGAKNAFVSKESDTNTSITIKGGTIYSVFGGNNWGGTLGASSYQHLVITNSNTDYSALGLQNTATTGFGCDFGIRYLFGGGNKVAGRNIDILVNGGQIDTLFGGGNAADVDSVNVTVNCAFGSGTASNDNNWALFGSTITKSIYDYDGVNVTLDGTYKWNGSGLYNVRTLFGGNNAADMSQVPTVNLTSGGVGTVYGGGNAGDMKASTAGTINGNSVNYSTHVVMDAGNDNIYVDYLYGGCQKSNVDYSTWVEIKGGNLGTVYGGCNISGDVGSKRVDTDTDPGDSDYLDVQGGTYVVATGGYIYNNLFAGSNGYYHCNDGIKYISGINYDDDDEYYISSTIPTHNETNVIVASSATIYGNVYAGGNLAPVGFPSNWASLAGNSDFPVTVGLATVLMTGGTVAGNVYGGGNMASIYGINQVKVTGGTISGALYGGNDRSGKVAQITNRQLPTTVASDSKTPLTNVATYVEVTGTPNIGIVYGGGNGDYDYSENSDIQFCDNADKPIQRNTFVDVNLTGGSDKTKGYIGTVYGGGDGVTVEGFITVFLNVETEVNSYDNVGTIFGGNNKCDLALVPDIILFKGQVGTVYGGCNQGAMTSDGETIYWNGTDSSFANVGSYVRLRKKYKANNEEDSAEVTATVSDYIYGGCRLNDVNKNSLVLVEGGTYDCVIYGGCDISGTVGVGDNSPYTSRVIVTGGTVDTVYGGGNGNYTYNSGNMTVYFGDSLMAKGTSTKPYCTNSRVDMYAGASTSNLYAGGYAGECGVTYMRVENGTVAGSIYGGGNEADVQTSTIMMIGGTVNTNVFGGGFHGAVIGETHVEIQDGTVTKNVYGGGENGDVGKATVIIGK